MSSSAHRVSEMERAGRVIFIGDTLVAAAALALLSRRRYTRIDLERVAWSLIFVNFLLRLAVGVGTAAPRVK